MLRGAMLFMCGAADTEEAMLVFLFIFNKESNQVALANSAGDGYNYPHAFHTGNTSVHDTVDKIANNIGIRNYDSDRAIFVRRQSHTAINNGDCKVDTICTYGYNLNKGDIDLSKIHCQWFDVGVAISYLCEWEQYFEAAYLLEAFRAV